MADSDLPPESEKPSFIERRVQRIASARSVTLGLAAMFLALAFAGAVVIRLADRHDFPSLGLAVWWALQTVTTVGYGDVVPTSNFGRIVGGLEMVVGISFIAFLVAGVTSTFIQRREAAADDEKRLRREKEFQAISGLLAELGFAIGELDSRLERIESRLRS